MHNATAITTGSANQRPNTPCIWLWIEVTFRGLEDSYSKTPSHPFSRYVNLVLILTLPTILWKYITNYLSMIPLDSRLTINDCNDC